MFLLASSIGFNLRQFSFYFACLFLSWRLLHIRYGFIFYLFLFFFCLILLAKISARFWHTVSSRLGDAFGQFFCSFSSIECVLHLFSNVSPLKFQFHVKFTFLYWFSLQVNKFCLVQQIKQLIFIWFSLTLFIKYVCVFFMLRLPSLSRWNIHNGEKGGF